jgi:hypothetical protein
MKKLGMVGLLMIGAAASAAAQSSPARDSVPAEYKPPKGMCRIWLKDVPPKQQPAPTDCAAAVKNVPQNGRVVFGDTDKDATKKPKDLPPEARGFTGKGKPPVVVKPPKKPPRR